MPKRSRDAVESKTSNANNNNNNNNSAVEQQQKTKKKTDGSSEIDDLFSKKKQDKKQRQQETKLRQQEERKQQRHDENGSKKARQRLEYSRKDVESIQENEWVDDGLGGKFNKDGYTGRVEGGVKVFKAHLFNRKNFGNTSLCPFDCDCCFI